MGRHAVAMTKPEKSDRADPGLQPHRHHGLDAQAVRCDAGHVEFVA